MAAKGMYETVKQAIQDLIAPDLERIKGEILGIKSELVGVRAEVNSLRNEMHAGFRSVDDRIDTLKERVADTNKRLDEALDIRERLATLEARFAARG